MSADAVSIRETSVEGGLRSVLSALDALDCFQADEELGVTEVARRIGVAKSSAHRLLTTLCARGLAERVEENGRYRLGLHLYELGQLVIERNAMRKGAMVMLQELHHLTGCTIHLAVPDGSEVVYLERLVEKRSVRAFSQVSRRLPSHCTGSGKVIAAFTPVAASARSVAGFKPMTTQSIHSSAQYDKALVDIRKKGFAMNIDEALTGFTSVAAPVLGHDGMARAAISIVWPNRQMLTGVGRPVRLVQTAARRLSKELCL
jgi:DNA-binding IclR family transcriptional regulator